MLGLTHTLSALISASLPGESLLGQVSCQAGQGSGSMLRSLLPAPYSPGSSRARGPLRTGSMQAGERRVGGGDTQVGPYFGQEGNFPLASFFPREAGLGPLPAPRPSPGPGSQGSLTGNSQGSRMELLRKQRGHSLHPPPAHLLPGSPPHVGKKKLSNLQRQRRGIPTANLIAEGWGGHPRSHRIETPGSSMLPGETSRFSSLE